MTGNRTMQRHAVGQVEGLLRCKATEVYLLQALEPLAESSLSAVVQSELWSICLGFQHHCQLLTAAPADWRVLCCCSCNRARRSYASM
jgi:hypothetical protein